MRSFGSKIIYREITHGKVWTVRPVTVIQDTPDLIALCLLNGTHWKVCTPTKEGTDLILCKADRRPWVLNDVIWSLGDTVILIHPGESHAVHVIWDLQKKFIGWYVNMQEPVRRTSPGFDFLDQELDIVVSPDLDWQWKDAHHLEQAKGIGLFSLDLVRKIEQEGQRIISQIESRATPFDESWSGWQVPHDWPIPGLPKEWGQIPLMD